MLTGLGLRLFFHQRMLSTVDSLYLKHARGICNPFELWRVRIAESNYRGITEGTEKSIWIMEVSNYRDSNQRERSVHIDSWIILFSFFSWIASCREKRIKCLPTSGRYCLVCVSLSGAVKLRSDGESAEFRLNYNVLEGSRKIAC